MRETMFFVIYVAMSSLLYFRIFETYLGYINTPIAWICRYNKGYHLFIQPEGGSRDDLAAEHSSVTH